MQSPLTWVEGLAARLAPRWGQKASVTKAFSESWPLNTAKCLPRAWMYFAPPGGNCNANECDESRIFRPPPFFTYVSAFYDDVPSVGKRRRHPAQTSVSAHPVNEVLLGSLSLSLDIRVADFLEAAEHVQGFAEEPVDVTDDGKGDRRRDQCRRIFFQPS